jgi:gluconate 2-dehydrogenase gamma chain
MKSAELSRRALLQALAAAAAAAPFTWTEILEAARQTHDHSAVSARDGGLSFFTPADAADVEAIAAQIIPTDDTPGAREAGVVSFIDRALATFFSQLGNAYRAQLAAFQTDFRNVHPGAASFASLPSDAQIEHLKTVDRTPFFDTTRVLTLLGMFSLPAYGGNREGVGWRLLGFEDAHVFQPPFGYYDRGYPGFVSDRGSVK